MLAGLGSCHRPPWSKQVSEKEILDVFGLKKKKKKKPFSLLKFARGKQYVQPKKQLFNLWQNYRKGTSMVGSCGKVAEIFIK